MIYLHKSRQRDNRAAATQLLRRGLAEEYGITGDLVFTYGPNGKPYLTEYPRVFFNISHCRTGAACVISDREAGIDIQDVRAFSQRTARRVCTEAELARLAASPAPERLFCRLWAVKEAYVKWHGGSILDEIVDTEAVISGALLHEGADYFVCCFGCDNGVVVIA
ncbi:MAG: 4'-phosphopantetheinyl transferase superfamily protein [Oscillospiraceae bacterium]|jgi:4'-phosphopantetheinyl transferase|nr:4'-phosphopantetheinyl transferase superfamily protein [Oscillospiraceae bacterium]